MADRIKGITIEIGGDTSKLSDSLKDVNKSIKDTQAELKDVDKLLKLDPSNVELLTQKQGLLAKATADTKEKLDKLKQAQEQMKASGVDETSAEYRALSREIADTEQQMKKLEDATNKTDDALSKTAKNAEKYAKSADKMAKATKGISKVATGALAGLFGLGVKAGQDADELNTLSKQTGLTTDSLQKMQYASDLIDVNVDDITSSFTKMKKQLDSGEKKFEEIGVHTKDAQENLRDSETVFNEVVVALGKISNETERDVKAMEIFGKSADELAGLIDDGGKAFRELSAEAEKSGAIISEEDLQKANELNDTLDKMKQQLGTSMAQVGVDVAQVLLPLLQELVPYIQKVADFLKQSNPEAIKLVASILGIIAVLSPLLSAISGIISAIGVIAPVVSGIVSAIGAVVAVIGGPLLAVIALVVAAIAVWIKNWEDIKLAFKLLCEIIVEWFENLGKKIKGIGDKIGAVWDSFVNKLKEGWEKVKSFFTQPLPTPKLKMPHINIQGKLSLNPPSVPKIKVDWYKKAYDDAYLLNSPTIFGASGGNLLGGGEGNGSEAVVGTDKLMSMMADVVGSMNIAVVLEGDAKGVFNLVRTENNRFMKANGGYSPFMA